MNPTEQAIANAITVVTSQIAALGNVLSSLNAAQSALSGNATIVSQLQAQVTALTGAGFATTSAEVTGLNAAITALQGL